jgi:hypothetical protein
MNKTLLTLLVAAVCAATAQATPVVGPGSPGALVISATGNLPLNGTGGSATATPSTLVLVGGNAEPNGCTGGVFEVLGPCRIQAVYAVPGRFSFTWAYSTADTAGPGGDIFGVLVDGRAITLSDLGGPLNQGGTSVLYTASSSFGWFINCTDCTSGAATATISGFTVPEPSSLALVLVAGIAAVGSASRRKGRAAG